MAIRTAAEKGSALSAIDDLRQQLPPSGLARQLRTDRPSVGAGLSDPLGGL